VGIYRDRVLPHLVEASLRGPDIEACRRRATAGLAGTVVEIGFGSGRNVAHYPAAVERVLAVEPSVRARAMGTARVGASTVPVEFVGLDGQALPLDDVSVDAVLSTWTLCSIPDLDRALAEARRVLRPGGALHFVEHGRHPDPGVQRWQRRLNPLQRWVFGCELDRDFGARLAAAGFTVDLAHHTHGPRTFGYLYEGTAVVA
jgi:SAM-dependent methyltransferase